MKTVDQGSVVTTAALPKFNQVPTITSPNGVVVAVPVEVTVDANAKAKAAIEKSPAELGKIALELSKQPGYEYLATLDKNNEINWVQVDLIQKNWDYTQEGLTPGAAALIAIAITIAAGPAGSGLTASMVATNAAGIALQTQAVITLINNKGGISKTLKDLASSATIRSMATAALTAGVGARLGLGSSVTDSFGQKLANGVSTSLTQAVADATINGVSFEEALKNSLLSSLVDVFAASAFTNLVKPIDTDEFVRNLAHKLVAASVGCVAASAKQQSCDAGALGAMVGEMLGDYLVDGSPLTPKQESDILNAAKLLAGSVALLTNVDLNTAASSASLAVENNALHPGDFVKVARDFENQCLKSTNAAQCSSALNKWKQTSYDRAGLKSSEAIQGWEDFAYSEYQPAIAICKTDRNCLAFVTSKLVTDSINFAGSSVDLIEVAHIAKLSAAKIMKDSGAFFVAGLDDFGWMIGSGVVTVPSRFTAPLISLYAQSGKVVSAPLSKVPSILDPAKFRSGMPSSWFKASYNPATKAVSISVAEIKTASGQVERVMSVSGNAWHGVNAPKSPITLNGINYKIIKDIPQNLAGTANHAGKNIFEYINTAYANQRVTVKLGVENTNSRAPGYVWWLRYSCTRSI
ncbi:DUF637 domain-containing protein [Psychrobacter urativorans]|uniref:DUF637 domain-containing protein n=1 Tax=Psychrobacter urativorans TaxID=45610 RepID=UPI00191AE799|nr:DUF637 domain-containing protein [Psychrobacter urativorans]